ncbi:MAG: AmmeMemoRadiSam system protein B [Prevotella sp.]|jgi:AmmeMemoRadiSam system protein B/AmmeMemoRadiSam system protein A
MIHAQSCGSKGLREPSVRPMAVAGQFYPADADSLREQIEESFKGTKLMVSDDTFVQSIIVPHAGYVFSAHAAAWSYAQLPRDKEWDHIFLLGPSHHVAFDGASVCDAYECYETPLGLVDVDTALASKLNRENKCFRYVAQAHTREHCLEVQLPMLQTWLRKPMHIVPIIIGTLNGEKLREIAEALRPWYNERNLFVISSDFSHYPSYDDACKVDKRTAEAITTGDLSYIARTVNENMDKGIPNLATSACGLCAILVNTILAENDSTANCRHLYYCNSGDSRYGSKDEVVGYNALVTTRKKQNGFQLSDADKQQLLRIARGCIENAVTGKKKWTTDSTNLSPTLKERCGAFVTLNEGGRLRGCIGHFGSDIPLYHVVEEMAVAAATEDPRFMPVKSSELDDIHIEISVLTPLKRIHDISEFQYGKQGIYIKKGYRSGTFLPQVAQEVNWTKEEFLGHCAQDKAGIGWDGWCDAELYTYEAIIFEEETK